MQVRNNIPPPMRRQENHTVTLGAWGQEQSAVLEQRRRKEARPDRQSGGGDAPEGIKAAAAVADVDTAAAAIEKALGLLDAFSKARAN